MTGVEGDLGPARRRPLLVGELNPYGVDPAMALYPLPLWASGHRLQLKLGLSMREYLRAFDRVNLCTGSWSAPVARHLAAGLMADGRHRDFVLLGARVAKAFGLEFRPFTRELRGGQWFVLLPHPSGRSRGWNPVDAGELARALLGEHLPHQGLTREAAVG